MTAIAVLKTVSSRVWIEDDDEEELLSSEDVVRPLLFRDCRLSRAIWGEEFLLGAGEATPRATS